MKKTAEEMIAYYKEGSGFKAAGLRVRVSGFRVYGIL